MQQDNNNIENKMRQLENQQLPDLSRMDEHWKQMQATLTPQGAVLRPAKFNKLVWSAAAVCLIGAVVLIVNYSLKKKNEITSLENKKIERGIKGLPDTTAARLRINTGNVSGINVKMPAISRQFNSGNHDTSPITEIMNDTILLPGTNQNSSAGTASLTFEAKQAMLKDLFHQVQKKSEIFTIDNSKDTVIKAREGSVIVIPANTFATRDTVVFEVKEFYKYSDMVGNGLTTLSDNRQLISGGMIYLSAKVKEKEIAMNPGREVRIFIPDITAKDSMQIFEGVKASGMGDTVRGVTANGSINWRLTTTRIDSPVVKMFMRAIDLKDDHITYTESNGKTKAVFFRARESVYNKDELQVMLQKKYGGYYDKIRVRKQWEKNLLFKKIVSEEEEYSGVAYNSFGVGDTAELLQSSIRIYKLNPIDTVYKLVRWINMGSKEVTRPLLPAGVLSNVGEKYNISLSKLGWINCDRFFNYAGKKSNFVIDLKDSSFNYVTYIAFEGFKSIMQGYEKGNHVFFPNIPMGVPVKIICIGVREGKIVAAVKQTITSGDILNSLEFEPTSSPDLKSSLSMLDKQGS